MQSEPYPGPTESELLGIGLRDLDFKELPDDSDADYNLRGLVLEQERVVVKSIGLEVEESWV